jgi:tripartite-type tricarboxylate transporter receptor subunit TctC
MLYRAEIAVQFARHCWADHGGSSRQNPRAAVRRDKPRGGGKDDRRCSRREGQSGRLQILQANTNHSFSQTFYRNLGYDLEKDFSRVARFASAFYIVLAHPKLGVKSLNELIEKAKAAPPDAK